MTEQRLETCWHTALDRGHTHLTRPASLALLQPSPALLGVTSDEGASASSSMASEQSALLESLEGALSPGLFEDAPLGGGAPDGLEELLAAEDEERVRPGAPRTRPPRPRGAGPRPTNRGGWLRPGAAGSRGAGGRGTRSARGAGAGRRPGPSRGAVAISTGPRRASQARRAAAAPATMAPTYLHPPPAPPLSPVPRSSRPRPAPAPAPPAPSSRAPSAPTSSTG